MSITFRKLALWAATVWICSCSVRLNASSNDPFNVEAKISQSARGEGDLLLEATVTYVGDKTLRIVRSPGRNLTILEAPSTWKPKPKKSGFGLIGPTNVETLAKGQKIILITRLVDQFESIQPGDASLKLHLQIWPEAEISETALASKQPFRVTARPIDVYSVVSLQVTEAQVIAFNIYKTSK